MPKESKRRAQKIAAQVRALVTSAGSQAELARLVGEPHSRISEWAAGRERVPPADSLLKLGICAAKRGLANAMFFWKEAGVEGSDLALMAKLNVAREQHGEAVLVPYLRETGDQRLAGGPDVPVPRVAGVDYASVVCLQVVFGLSGSLVGPAPPGVFILDTSAAAVATIGQLAEPRGPIELSGSFVMLRRDYVHNARASCQFLAGSLRVSHRHRSVGRADLILDEMWGGELPLGIYQEAAAPAEPPDIQRHTHGEEAVERAMRTEDDYRRRVLAGVKLDPGYRVVGRVIGWLIEPPRTAAASERPGK